MSKDLLKSDNSRGILKFTAAFLIEIAVTAVLIAVFALVIYLSGGAAKYAPVFATVSVAAGCFFAVFFTARRSGSRGWLTGLIIGGITFLVITAVSLFVNSGGVTINTLFHFIIIMLSSVVGGIIGVNRANNHKYI